MMAYKLVHDLDPSLFPVASMVILCSTIGGQVNTFAPAVFHDPVITPASRGISVKMVHGELDTTVPPFPDPAIDTYYFSVTGLLLATASLRTLDRAGLPDLMTQTAYATHYYPLVDAQSAYVQYNLAMGMAATLDERFDGDSLDPAEPSTVRTFGGPVESTNPVVEVIVDPTMDHTNIAGPGRWLFASDVWAFFKEHPRP